MSPENVILPGKRGGKGEWGEAYVSGESVHVYIGKGAALNFLNTEQAKTKYQPRKGRIFREKSRVKGIATNVRLATKTEESGESGTVLETFTLQISS